MSLKVPNFEFGELTYVPYELQVWIHEASLITFYYRHSLVESAGWGT